MMQAAHDMDALIDEFRQRHYVIVKGFYPVALIETYQKFLRKSLENDVLPILKRLGLSLDTPELGRIVSERIEQDQALDAAEKHLLMGHFPLHVRLSDQIHPLAHHLGQSALLKQLLDSEHLYMHMPPMMRYVPPSYNAAAVPPHQDSSYNPHMSNFVTVWTPLVPIDLKCGGMIMYEDSHHETLPVATEANGWLTPVATEKFKRTQLDGLGPGDAVILSPHIIHASAPNISDRIRYSMDLRVFGQSGRSTKHHMNLDTLEVHIA